MGAPFHSLNSRKYFGMGTFAPEGSEKISLSARYGCRNPSLPAWSGWTVFIFLGRFYWLESTKLPTRRWLAPPTSAFAEGPSKGLLDREPSTLDGLCAMPQERFRHCNDNRRATADHPSLALEYCEASYRQDKKSPVDVIAGAS